MAISLGTIYGEVKLSLGQLNQDAKQVKNDMNEIANDTKNAGEQAKTSHHAFSGFLKKVAGMVAALGITHALGAAFGFVKDQLQESVSAAMNYQQTQASLTAILQSTHEAAGETSKSLNDLADSLSHTTTYSDETVLSAETMMLTFNNVGKKGGVFDAAVKASMNLSSAMGVSLTRATRQVGRALQDPVKGLSSLTRYGITFTKAQKAMIQSMVNSGHTMQAQQYILAQLHDHFGGVAVAAGQTLAGQLTILRNSMEELHVKIGEAILPILTKLLRAVMPLITQFADDLPGAIATVGNFFDTYLEPSLMNISNLLINQVVPDLTELWQFLQVNVLPILLTVGKAVIGSLVHAFHQAQQALASAHPQIEALEAALVQVEPVGKALAVLLGVTIVVAIGIIMGAINALIGAFKGIIEIFTGVLTFLRGAWDIIVGLFTLNGDKIGKGFHELFSGMAEIVSGYVTMIIGMVSGFVNGVLNWFNNLTHGGVTQVKDLVTGISAAIAGLPQDFATIAAKIIQGLVNGIKNGIGSAVGAVKNLGSSILSAISNFFGIHSPSRVMADLAEHGLMAGLVQGITHGSGAVNTAFQTATAGLTSLPSSSAGLAGAAGSLKGQTTVNIYLTVEVETSGNEDEDANEAGTQFGTSVGYGIANALAQRGY